MGAIFKVANDGQLEPINYVSTFGKTPRHFAISPDDEWLIGANQDSNNLVVFRRDVDNGKLEMHKKYEDIVCAPNYCQFAPIPAPKMVEKKEEEKEGNPRTNWMQIMFMLMAIFVGVLLKISLF